MELLEAVRKALNETRQDKTCRTFMARKGAKSGLIPYLGSPSPVYLFLGLNPAGYDIDEPPTGAEDYIDFATHYFSREESDKGSFATYLPFTSNTTGDYAAFGQVSSVTHLVPIPTQRTSEVTMPLVRSCWPKVRPLLGALRPKLIFCHGSLVWKFLAGLEEPGPLAELPEALKQNVADLYDKTEADRLPFQSRLEGLPEDFRPWFVPLVHLGGSGGGKDVRKKAEQATVHARRVMHAPAATAGGGTRIRVRRPDA